jgi:hypothetical protein
MDGTPSPRDEILEWGICEQAANADKLEVPVSAAFYTINLTD